MLTALTISRTPRTTLTVRAGLALLSLFGLFGLWRAARWMNDARTAAMIDIDVYRNAGAALLHGESLYGEAASAHGLPYLYTPFASVLFAPFSWLSVQQTHVVWTMLLLASLYVVVRQSLEYASPALIERHRLLVSMGAFGATLALEPVAQNFKFGQINLVIAAAILLDLRGRTGPLPRGVLIGIAAGVKLTPLIFVAYLFFTERRRVAIVAASTFTATVAIGFAISASSSWTYWTDVAYDTSRVGVAFVTNQSINGFFSRILGGPEAVGILYKLPSVAVCIGGLMIAVRAARQGRPMLGDVVVGLTALLVSPISWSHHWVWIIPLFAWLALASDAPRWGKYAAIAGFTVFWISPIQWIPRGDGVEYHYTFVEVLQGNSYLFAALACMAALGATTFTRQRSHLGPTDTRLSQ